MAEQVLVPELTAKKAKQRGKKRTMKRAGRPKAVPRIAALRFAGTSQGSHACVEEADAEDATILDWAVWLALLLVNPQLRIGDALIPCC